MFIDLTVIIKDKNGKLFEGAEITVTPGDFTGETNSEGETTIRIEGANRYQVGVAAGSATQTVPYYPTKNQNQARLEVSLQYFEQLEKADSSEVEVQAVAEAPTPWYQVPQEQSGYLLVGMIILLATIVVAMRAAIKNRKHTEVEKITKADNLKKSKAVGKKSTKK